ncbi:MAG: S41 family peptidase [Vallitalea sp.]|jgi:hypothetical protein|nr:S41 family peptidase [Vallitalea sp.]
MRKKLLLSLVLANIMVTLFSITVFAGTNEGIYEDVERLGNTRYNAMKNGNISYENGWFYFNLDNNLVKQNTKNNDVEVIINEEISCLNVLDGIVYGYINYGDSSNNKSGIYKVNTNDKTTKLIYDGMKPSQLIVIDDWIYFTNDVRQSHYKGIYRIKTDGSNFETLYKGYIDSFTIYKNKIYLTLNGKLFSVEIGGDKLNQIAEKFELWSKFTIYDDYIYTNKLYSYENCNDFECGIVKISIDGKHIEVLHNTETSCYYAVRGEYIYFHNSDEGIYKMKLDGTERESIILTSDIYNLSIFDEYIYFHTYEDYRDYDSHKHWYCKLDGSNERCLVPYHYKYYDEVKRILEKAIYNINNCDRINTKVEIIKDDYNENEDENFNEDINAEIKIDRINNIAYNKINKIYTSDFDDWKNETFYEHWYDKDSFFLSNIKNKWYYNKTDEQQSEKVYNHYIDIYSFLDLGHDYLRNLSLTETPNTYILKGEGSFERVINKLSDKFCLAGFFEEHFNRGALKIEIIINKSNYYIEKLKMVNQANDDSYKVTISLTNEFPKDRLIIPSIVKSSISKSKQCEKYMDLAGKSIQLNNYKQAINYCNTALNVYEYALDSHIMKGFALFQQGKYESAIEEYNKYIDKAIFREFNDGVYALIAEANNSLSNYYEANKYIDKYSYHGWELEDAYCLKALIEGGIARIGLNDLKSAVKYFNLALKIDPYNLTAIILKSRALYNSGNYKECIKFAEEYAYIDSRMIWDYKGGSYLLTDDIDKAIDCYKKIISLPNDDVITNNYVYSQLGYIYCEYLQDYNTAEIYKYKVINPNEDDLQYKDTLNYLIKEGRKPQVEKVSNFVENNYLYNKKNNNLYNKIEEFRNKKHNITPQEVAEFIEDIRKDDDKFTWVLYGENYDKYVDYNKHNEISYKQLDDNTEYIKVNSFLHNTGSKFVSHINSIKNPEEKTLIIDLRDNGGGEISSCIKMMDILLPECISAYLIDKYGKPSEGYSDENMVEFKDINILVNNYSASCSEMFTLSLKKYLNNVTVLGKNTYGKGVAQNTYEDKNNKYVIFLVSYYWNVLEENINGKGIKPDIIVEGEELEDFIKVINESEKK